MPETKYITNNASQLIDGNFTVTGSVKSNSTGVYKALFTQTPPQIGVTSLSNMGGALIPGETYFLSNYQSGDDFSNIANVTSGTINQTGCEFIATGKFPTSWNNGSSLDSSGNLIADVLENTLGYDIDCSEIAPGAGAYLLINDDTGPWINSFPRNRTSVKIGPLNLNAPLINISPSVQILGGVASLINTDDLVYFSAFDADTLSNVSGALYYQYVEVNVQQYSETGTVDITGTLPSFPCGNASIRLYSGANTVHNAYTTVNADDVEELASIFNSQSETQALGTYSVNLAGDLILTMSENLKLQFSPDDILTFNVFND